MTWSYIVVCSTALSPELPHLPSYYVFNYLMQKSESTCSMLPPVFPRSSKTTPFLRGLRPGLQAVSHTQTSNTLANPFNSTQDMTDPYHFSTLLAPCFPNHWTTLAKMQFLTTAFLESKLNHLSLTYICFSKTVFIIWSNLCKNCDRN